MDIRQKIRGADPHPAPGDGQGALDDPSGIGKFLLRAIGNRAGHCWSNRIIFIRMLQNLP
ncbi:hypothetical protein JCM17845_04490 [Iodidimonas gelatinilytica]|uniref:Uncharacterized protein n=1 Tax=Iodidimonas gelatinilytica TaxID=1236966 RepID=A0A5A7MYA3_9PROT|nr:hypothetical protein JCM17845_04490 [Iodidimonas gelatinilytica]